MNCNESKFELKITIDKEISEHLGRKIVHACIHVGNHVIGDIWQLALGEAFESCVFHAIEMLEESIEIDFPAGTPVEVIFDCLYYAECGVSWGEKWVEDDAGWNKNAKKIFDLTGVQLSQENVGNINLYAIPSGTEPFDGYSAYCVKISGEENLIWRTYSSPDVYNIKITKKCIIDEYRRALDAAHLTA